MSVVIGIDAWSKGWVAVTPRDKGKPLVTTSDSLESLLDDQADCEVVAIDMPIGLPADGEVRPYDGEAKQYVGPRRSSVFPTSPRSVLATEPFKAAVALAQKQTGKGISQQSYALRTKIFVVEAVAANDDRLIEVHPEVSFRAMAGQELAFSKRTWNGQRQRAALLSREGIDLPEELDGETGSVPVDDVLDAAAAAWLARRFASGDAESFPDSAQPGTPAIWR